MNRLWDGSALGGVGQELLLMGPRLAAGFLVLLSLMALGQGVRWWFYRRQSPAEWNRVRGSIAVNTGAAVGLVAALLIILPLETSHLFWILTACLAGGIFALARVVPGLNAGLRVLGSKWIRVGDEISMDGFSGIVMDSNLHTTALRTHDGRIAVIPNDWLLNRPFTNDSTLRKRRSTTSMELSVDEDLAYAVEVIKDAISETKGVLKDPLPSVCIRALSDRRVTLELVWWTVSKPAEMDRVRDSVIFAIRCSLRDAEIALPSSGEQFFMDCIRTYDQQDRPAERQLGIREESEPGIVKDPFAL